MFILKFDLSEARDNKLRYKHNECVHVQNTSILDSAVQRLTKLLPRSDPNMLAILVYENNIIILFQNTMYYA